MQTIDDKNILYVNINDPSFNMFGIPYVCSRTMKEQRDTSSKRYSNQKHRNTEDIVGTIDNGQVLLTFTLFIEYICMYIQNYHFRLLNTVVFCLGTINSASYIRAQKIIQRCQVLCRLLQQTITEYYQIHVLVISR